MTYGTYRLLLKRTRICRDIEWRSKHEIKSSVFSSSGTEDRIKVRLRSNRGLMETVDLPRCGLVFWLGEQMKALECGYGVRSSTEANLCCPSGCLFAPLNLPKCAG
jgi:hypothetical protein